MRAGAPALPAAQLGPWTSACPFPGCPSPSPIRDMLSHSQMHPGLRQGAISCTPKGAREMGLGWLAS